MSEYVYGVVNFFRQHGNNKKKSQTGKSGLYEWEFVNPV